MLNAYLKHMNKIIIKPDGIPYDDYDYESIRNF
jgi:hypothetical protein